MAAERIVRLSRAALAHWRSRHVGFVFQLYNLLPALTAERDVEIPMLLTSLSATELRRKVAATLQLVGLPDRHMHTPG